MPGLRPSLSKGEVGEPRSSTLTVDMSSETSPCGPRRTSIGSPVMPGGKTGKIYAGCGSVKPISVFQSARSALRLGFVSAPFPNRRYRTKLNRARPISPARVAARQHSHATADPTGKLRFLNLLSAAWADSASPCASSAKASAVANQACDGKAVRAAFA